MRVDKSTNDIVHYEDSYYVIEEYRFKSNRWIPLTSRYYLKEYEFCQHTSCGDCWQETSNHGIYDLEYAKVYCNALNDALADGRINPTEEGVSRFRIAKIERVYKHEVLTPNKY